MKLVSIYIGCLVIGWGSVATAKDPVAFEEAFPFDGEACAAQVADASHELWTLAERHKILQDFGRPHYLAYSTLQPNLRYFDMRIGGRRAYIAFRRRLGIPLVVGDPVGEIQDLPVIIDAFMKQHSGLFAQSPSFCSASRPVAEILNSYGHYANEIGAEAVHDLTQLDFAAPDWSRTRQNAGKTMRAGFEIYESSWAEEKLRDPDLSEARELTQSWRASRPGGNKELDFLNRPYTLVDEPGVRLVFVRNSAQRLVAYYVYEPLYENGRTVGYLLNFKRYSLDPEIFPNIVDYGVFKWVLEKFKEEGKTKFSLGISALAHIHDDQGGLLYSKPTSAVMRWIYDRSVAPLPLPEGAGRYQTMWHRYAQWRAEKIREHLFNFSTLAHYKFVHRKGRPEPQYFTSPHQFTPIRVIALSLECGFLTRPKPLDAIAK